MKTIYSLIFLLFCFSIIKLNAQVTEKNYKIYSVKLQKEVTVDQMVEMSNEYDVVFYGEEHNDSVTHFLEKTVFEKMYAKYNSKLALSMEMFERDIQGVMNEYLGGNISERHFKKDARVWSNYKDYRPMVEFAKANKLSVVCANAAGRYTNIAGKKGQKELMKLPKESLKNIAPLPYDTATGKYYEKLLEMSGHTPPGKTDTAKTKAPAMSMGNFNLPVAQSLWDATMAYSIAEYAKKNKGHKIFQVNGRFHSDQGFAVVNQLKKYGSKLKPMIISTGSVENFENPDWNSMKENGDFIIATDPNVPRSYEDK